MTTKIDAFVGELDQILSRMSDYYNEQSGIKVGGIPTYSDLSDDELGDLETAIEKVSVAIDWLMCRQKKESKP